MGLCLSCLYLINAKIAMTAKTTDMTIVALAKNNSGPLCFWFLNNSDFSPEKVFFTSSFDS